MCAVCISLCRNTGIILSYDKDILWLPQASKAGREGEHPLLFLQAAVEGRHSCHPSPVAS